MTALLAVMMARESAGYATSGNTDNKKDNKNVGKDDAAAGRDYKKDD